MKDMLGLGPMDMQWLIAARPTEYYAFVSGRADTTGAAEGKGKRGARVARLGMAQAMILRMLSLRGEEALLIPRSPTLGEFHAFLIEIDPEFENERRLGVLLGRDGTAGYRWVKRASSNPLRAENQQWMHMIWNLLHAASASGRRALLNEIFERVVNEAALRGYDPVHLKQHFNFRTAAEVEAMPTRRRRPKRALASAVTARKKTPAKKAVASKSRAKKKPAAKARTPKASRNDE